MAGQGHHGRRTDFRVISKPLSRVNEFRKTLMIELLHRWWAELMSINDINDTLKWRTGSELRDLLQKYFAQVVQENPRALIKMAYGSEKMASYGWYATAGQLSKHLQSNLPYYSRVYGLTTALIEVTGRQVPDMYVYRWEKPKLRGQELPLLPFVGYEDPPESISRPIDWSALKGRNYGALRKQKVVTNVIKWYLVTVGRPKPERWMDSEILYKELKLSNDLMDSELAKFISPVVINTETGKRMRFTHVQYGERWWLKNAQAFGAFFTAERNREHFSKLFNITMVRIYRESIRKYVWVYRFAEGWGEWKPTKGPYLCPQCSWQDELPADAPEVCPECGWQPLIEPANYTTESGRDKSGHLLDSKRKEGK